MDNGEYSTDYSEYSKVSTQHYYKTYSTSCSLWTMVLYRLFRILQGEYTTLILDLLYKLLIMDKGEYSTDYSESCRVSGLNGISICSTKYDIFKMVSTLHMAQN